MKRDARDSRASQSKGNGFQENRRGLARARFFAFGPHISLGIARLFLRSKKSSDGLQRQDGTGDEGRLLLEHRVVDRRSKAFVQDLDAEELRGGGGSVFVGGRDRDVEGQALVGVPGKSRFLKALDGRQRDVVELFGGGVDGKRNIPEERRAEGAGTVGRELVGDLELGTDVIGVRPAGMV